MAAYIYKLDTGELYNWFAVDNPTAKRNFSKATEQWEEDPVIAPDEVLAAKGFACVRGLPAIDATHRWNAEERTVETFTPTPVDRVLSKNEFVLAFTPAEFDRITRSEDPAVRQFVFIVQGSQEITMTSATTINGLGYLVQLGLLEQERAAQIAALGS